MTETQVEKIMRLLQCTKEEALDVIEQDKIIDKGGKPAFCLTDEEEKKARKFANVKDKPKGVYNWDNRERKKNETKAEIIAALAQFLTGAGYENIEIANAERMINFTVGGKKYDLTLIQKRK